MARELIAGEKDRALAAVIRTITHHPDKHPDAFIWLWKTACTAKPPSPKASEAPRSFSEGGGAEPQTIVPKLPWVHAMRQQAMNFIAAIQGKSKPPCEAAEALEDLKVASEYIRLLKS